MTLLYCSPCFLDHETGDHPERADRIRQIPARLKQAGLLAQCRQPEFKPVSRQRLARVHSPAYIDEIWAFAKSGGGYIEADTVVSPASYDVALMAAGSVCDAVERLVARRRHPGPLPGPSAGPPRHGQPRDGLLPVQQRRRGRPAGHRRRSGSSRVLIVDWDIHHGNGTQATFWEDPQVGFLSIHRWPFYPGTGDADETGGGRGLGCTLNLPIEYGTPRKDYPRRLRRQPGEVRRQDQAAVGAVQRRLRRPSPRSGGRPRPGNRGLHSR